MTPVEWQRKHQMTTAFDPPPRQGFSQRAQRVAALQRLPLEPIVAVLALGAGRHLQSLPKQIEALGQAPRSSYRMW
jgi:hypothetical protein